MDELLGTDENVEPYYFDAETAEIAQNLKEKDDLKILFDACRDISSEDIKTVIGMVNMLKKK